MEKDVFGEELSKKFMQTYLYLDGFNYFVSTIYRKSSAALNPDGWYYETFAWQLNEKNEKEGLIEDNSGAVSQKRALEQHQETINNLINQTLKQAL